MGSNVYDERDHERNVEIQDELRSRAAWYHRTNHADCDLPVSLKQPSRSRLRALTWTGGVSIAATLALFPWIAALSPGALAVYAEPAPPPRSQVVAPAAIATQASQPPAERVSATPTQTPATPPPPPTPPPVQGSPTPAPLPVPTTPPLPVDAPKVVPTAEATESPKPKNCLLLCPPAN